MCLTLDSGGVNNLIGNWRDIPFDDLPEFIAETNASNVEFKEVVDLP